jgi:hypothetical protein
MCKTICLDHVCGCVCAVRMEKRVGVCVYMYVQNNSVYVHVCECVC